MGALDYGEAPARGTLTVTVFGAEFEPDYVDGDESSCSTYCVLWVLEPTRRRRRRTVLAPRTMHPAWQQVFSLDDTSAEAKVVVDVWRELEGKAEGGADDYFGKVTLRANDLPPLAKLYELVQGSIKLSASFVADGSPDTSDVSEAEPKPESIGRAAAALPAAAYREPPAPAAQPRPAPPAPFEDEVQEVDESQEEKDFGIDLLKKVDEESYDEDFEDVPATSALKKQPELADLDFPAQPLSNGGANGGPLDYYEYTHRGGDGKGAKENQDAFFTLQLDAQNYVWCVLDGHGHDNGRIAAEAARDSLKGYFSNRANFELLRSEPQEVDEYCPLGYDVVDGGTTCTLAALIDGRTLVVAAVGDSCGVLANCAGGRVNTQELIAEHSALSQKEFELIGGGGLEFVYEYPDMDSQGPLPVWELDAKGKAVLCQHSIQAVDSYGMGFKTERGDRAAFLLTPE
ncbi:hypothetical protein T492DRAFT_1103858, partial [Pavlovales sp. CCMP2436]